MGHSSLYNMYDFVLKLYEQETRVSESFIDCSYMLASCVIYRSAKYREHGLPVGDDIVPGGGVIHNPRHSHIPHIYETRGSTHIRLRLSYFRQNLSHLGQLLRSRDEAVITALTVTHDSSIEMKWKLMSVR